MRAPGGLDQPVRHQRAGGDDGVDDAAIDQFGDDQPLLGDGHRARKGHYDEAFFVARHRFQHVGAFAHLAAGKSGVAHGPHQVIHGVDLRQIQRLQRYQLVRNRIVQLAINSFAVRLVLVVHSGSPRMRQTNRA